eukprot:7147387-Prymnesium_polylepis.1
MLAHRGDRAACQACSPQRARVHPRQLFVHPREVGPADHIDPALAVLGGGDLVRRVRVSSAARDGAQVPHAHRHRGRLRLRQRRHLGWGPPAEDADHGDPWPPAWPCARRRRPSLSSLRSSAA